MTNDEERERELDFRMREAALERERELDFKMHEARAQSQARERDIESALKLAQRISEGAMSTAARWPLGLLSGIGVVVMAVTLGWPNRLETGEFIAAMLAGAILSLVGPFVVAQETRENARTQREAAEGVVTLAYGGRPAQSTRVD